MQGGARNKHYGTCAQNQLLPFVLRLLGVPPRVRKRWFPNSGSSVVPWAGKSCFSNRALVETVFEAPKISNVLKNRVFGPSKSVSTKTLLLKHYHCRQGCRAIKFPSPLLGSLSPQVRPLFTSCLPQFCRKWTPWLCSFIPMLDWILKPRLGNHGLRILGSGNSWWAEWNGRYATFVWQVRARACVTHLAHMPTLKHIVCCVKIKVLCVIGATFACHWEKHLPSIWVPPFASCAKNITDSKKFSQNYFQLQKRNFGLVESILQCRYRNSLFFRIIFCICNSLVGFQNPSPPPRFYHYIHTLICLK